VFDKTGTLTEDGLDMKCILPAREDNSKSKNVIFDTELNEIKMFNESDNVFLEAMATCHSISRVDGMLIGDPLDCKMFEFTKWDLIEPMPEQTQVFNMFVPTIVFPKTSTFKSQVCYPYSLKI
jgi:magnesium-transporting ATPase (P-type)